MARNLMKNKSEEKPEGEKPEDTQGETQGTIIEREINLPLLNEKLNYILSAINKIAEACEVDLSK